MPAPLRRLHAIAAVLMLAGSVLFITPHADACPLCAESLPNEAGPGVVDPDSAIAAGPVSHPSGGAARGYSWSILLMLCVPFGTAAGLGTMLVWQVRRQRRANARLPVMDDLRARRDCARLRDNATHTLARRASEGHGESLASLDSHGPVLDSGNVSRFKAHGNPG